MHVVPVLEEPSVKRAATQQLIPSTEPASTTPPPKVVVIDDDRISLTYTVMTLKREGYEVHRATDGTEGLALIRSLCPDLIICDWMMPGTNGIQVCKLVKQDPALAPAFFILLTGRTKVEDLIRGFDTGADEFLAKPVTGPEMRARVRAGLRIARMNQALRTVAQDLQSQKQRLEVELQEAADYVRSLLPQALKPLDPAIAVQSYFVLSSQLGGDFFDFHWLDEHHLRIYLMDTAGHGLRAAFFSISVQHFLKSLTRSKTPVDLFDPAQVLQALNDRFQMEDHNNQYVTVWYGIFDRRTQQLTYSNAGHPPAVLLNSTLKNVADRCQILPSSGPPIGILPFSRYKSQTCSIEPGSTLYIFSDGLYEVIPPEEIPPDTEPCGHSEFLKVLQGFERSAETDLKAIPQRVLEETGKTHFSDDRSLIRVRFDGGASGVPSLSAPPFATDRSVERRHPAQRSGTPQPCR
ncbi:MAG: SpoIIE family protein phosphatase [Prochlorothrix sp.]